MAAAVQSSRGSAAATGAPAPATRQLWCRIGANLSDELGIPDENEDKWIATELNSILINNVVCDPHGHLCTFGGIEWECGLMIYSEC